MINIQRLIDSTSAYGEVYLPQGEFEGPFTVNKPCRIIGDNTTLWCGSGTILTIKAGGAELENLRAEITCADPNSADCAAICCEADDTKFDGVEIIGRVIGIDGEDKPWGIPRTLELGTFPAERQCTFKAELIVPVETDITSLFQDMTIEPRHLSSGRNTVTVTCAPIRAGSYIYGEVLLRSEFIRRIYISGAAGDAPEYIDGAVIFSADENALAAEEEALKNIAVQKISEQEIIFPDFIEPPPDTNEMYIPPVDDTPAQIHSLCIIERGMVVTPQTSELEIELIYDNKDFPMDVDAFAFMADKHGNVTHNDRFVFFGNDRSLCGGVRYLNAPDKKAMYINFNIMPLDVNQIDIAYSIYENPRGLNFSDLINPAISIKTGDGQQMIFRLEPPLNQSTLVGLEIRYENSRWGISPLGMIYPMGLANLCGNYGLKIL
ncbi:MAG: TerD family protein [Oscillospiraceae bacterium]